MRLITIRDSTDSPGLELRTDTDPTPGAGEVLITVAAAGVNRADLLQRRGHYPPPPGASEILGLECSGTIAALGPDVTTWRVGDRVMALLDGGGYASLVTAPVGQLLPVPADMPLISAAAYPEALATAWSNLVMVGQLQPGQTVLIHGGSGGVGTIAIQLAHHLGARVITTAGGPERTARCRELGADVAIDHRQQDVAAEALKATDGRGVDLILDILGAGALATNLDALATGGKLVVIGLQRGSRGELNLGKLLAKRATISGTTLRSRPAPEKAEIIAAVRDHALPLVAAGKVRAAVHNQLPLAEAEAAHDALAAGEVFGKLLLVP